MFPRFFCTNAEYFAPLSYTRVESEYAGAMVVPGNTTAPPSAAFSLQYCLDKVASGDWRETTEERIKLQLENWIRHNGPLEA
jgi:hypothetical protein